MELEKCPFCDELALMIKTDDKYRPFVVICQACSCQTMPSVTEEKAIERWNKRVVKNSDIYIPENEYQIEVGMYDINDIAALLLKHKHEVEAIEFIAEMLEE